MRSAALVQRSPKSQFKRQLLWLSFAVLFGWWQGELAWALVFGLTTLLLWHSWQLYRLMTWLHKNDHRDVPEAPGIWGDLFDELHRLLNRHRKAEDKLRQVIARVQKSTSALQDAVIMLDSSGDLEWWNRSARRLLGLRRPDDIGEPITNLQSSMAQFHYWGEKGQIHPDTDQATRRALAALSRS